MLNMGGPKLARGIMVRKPEGRSKLVGMRLRPGDVEALKVLAAEAGVGISTFARLIVEEYLAAHRQEDK
jgi:predicted DNA binding CopG/RHH family protein